MFIKKYCCLTFTHKILMFSAIPLSIFVVFWRFNQIVNASDFPVTCKDKDAWCVNVIPPCKDESVHYKEECPEKCETCNSTNLTVLHLCQDCSTDQPLITPIKENITQSEVNDTTDTAPHSYNIITAGTLTTTETESSTQNRAVSPMYDLDEERRRTYWLYAMIIIPVIILTVTFVVKKKLECGLSSVQLKKHSGPGRARYYLDSATYQIMGLESGSQQYVSENPCINLYRYRDFRWDFEAQTDSHDQQRRNKLSLLQSRFMSAYKVLSAISDSGSQASSVDQPQQEHGKWLSVRKNFDRIDRRNSSSQENLQRNDKEEQQQLTRSNNSSEEIVNNKELVYANLDFSHVQQTDCRSPATMEPVKYAVIDFQESAKKTKY